LDLRCKVESAVLAKEEFAADKEAWRTEDSAWDGTFRVLDQLRPVMISRMSDIKGRREIHQNYADRRVVQIRFELFQRSLG
jgi:hypothetical protein